MRNILTTVLLFLCAGCTTPTIDSPPPSPQPVQVVITPSLDPLWRKNLSDCAGKNPEMALVLEVIPTASIHQQDADIILRTGEPEEGISGPVFQVGWEEIGEKQTPLPDSNLRQPILAITETEPEGAVKSLLICLQESYESIEP